MARQVIVWTTTAWEDLDRIAKFIARDSRNYAASFVREVRDASRSLESLAERGRWVPELKRPDIRELIVLSHRLVYKVDAEQILILGLIHCAQDFGKAWRRREPRSGDSP